MNTKDKIEEILRRDFSIQYLQIIDDSESHRGHAEAQKNGGGHFSIVVVSKDFEGKKSVERHRLIHNALKSEFQSQIHALSIETLTPIEYQTTYKRN